MFFYFESNLINCAYEECDQLSRIVSVLVSTVDGWGASAVLFPYRAFKWRAGMYHWFFRAAISTSLTACSTALRIAGCQPAKKIWLTWKSLYRNFFIFPSFFLTRTGLIWVSKSLRMIYWRVKYVNAWFRSRDYE